MRRVTRVEVLEGYRLDLTFDDGARGAVDLSHLAGRGVFTLWLDRGAFEAVRLGPSGELAWDDGIDLCPDALYLRATGKSVEEVFPGAPSGGSGSELSAARAASGPGGAAHA